MSFTILASNVDSGNSEDNVDEKNWPKVSSKEKLAEVKGERESDSLRFAEDSISYFPSVERFK